MKKELLFSIRKEDFDISFFRGSGNGGQKKQKTSSACRIAHKESGAVGTAQDSRSQTQNKKLAFERCINSKKFQIWFTIKKASTLKGVLDIDQAVEEKVNELMQEKNIKIEYYSSK